MSVDTRLAEYESYLRKRRLARDKHVPFMTGWVRKFLGFARRHREASFELVLEKFEDYLQGLSGYKDWQIKQALDAVKIYQYQFRADAALEGAQRPADNTISDELAAAKLREIIRLRHYSYQTEKTYLGWTRRFLDYCSGTTSNRQRAPARRIAPVAGQGHRLRSRLAPRTATAATR